MRKDRGTTVQGAPEYLASGSVSAACGVPVSGFT